MKKEDFLANLDEWSSHRSLLWKALETTKHTGLPILELGSGPGSTPYLREYCESALLDFHTYESNEEWAEKMNSIYVKNWEIIPWRKVWGVVLIDMAPGEYRKIALRKLDNAQIIVLHDSEPPGHNGSDYQVRNEFSAFKYFKDHEAQRPHAWTTILSNIIDVTKFEV